MNKKRNKNYERVMSRVFNNSHVSSASNSHVMRHEVPSSVRVGAKPTVSYVSSSVFSELPTVLNDYVPEDSLKKIESSVRMSKVVKPRRTLKSLDTSKSPPRTATNRTVSVSRNLRAEESAPVVKGDEEWSESHLRQCYSSRSHTKLKDLKDEIKAYHETEKFMRWRSHLYKKCGVVFDEDGAVASDKAVQADVEKVMDTEELIRCREWLTAIDREDKLVKKNFSHANYKVCSAHFDYSDIIVTTRNRLKKSAVPKIQSENEFQKAQVIPSRQEKSTQCEVLEGASIAASNTYTSKKVPILTNTSRKRKLSVELASSKQKCPELDYKFIKIEKELKGKPSVSSQGLIDEVIRRSRKLIEWQNTMKNKLKGNRCDSEYKMFLLNFHYSSPHAYKCLKTILKLPSQSTLNRFKINIPPKLDERLLKILELKMKSLPDNAKYCTICIDDMTLKKNLCYDTGKDEIVGFQNINGKVTPEIATNAYTIMLQGIVINWVQPIAYALTANEKHCGIWLMNIISELSVIGIQVKAIISHQGLPYAQYLKRVKKLDKQHPYFINDNLKLYFIFDIPHLIKCICNNLLTSDFYHDGKRISWDYIKQLYDDQKDKNLRLLPKITETHIEPTDFEKINVKYAAQIFSRAVSTALHTYIDLGKISEEARPTANFIQTMNNLFDVLNSSKAKSHSKYQSAFSRNKDQEEVLCDALEMFSSIKACKRNTGKGNIADMTSFVNIQISIQSIKMLYDDLTKEGIKFILTRRLNQESLENFLSSIYQGCSCSEPTPIQFQRTFSKLLVSNMVESCPYGNRKIDIVDALLKAEDMKEVNFTDCIVLPQTSKVYLGGETDYRMDLPEEKENTLIYVASYLLFKCNNKHKCPSFDEALESLPNLSKFKSYNKNSAFYGCLKMPSAEFIKYVEDLETAFFENFDKVVKSNPGGQIYELLRAIPPQTPCSCFPVDYLLKLFVRLRIFSWFRFNNSMFKDDINNVKSRLKISSVIF